VPKVKKSLKGALGVVSGAMVATVSAVVVVVAGLGTVNVAQDKREMRRMKAPPALTPSIIGVLSANSCLLPILTVTAVAAAASVTVRPVLVVVSKNGAILKTRALPAQIRLVTGDLQGNLCQGALVARAILSGSHREQMWRSGGSEVKIINLLDLKSAHAVHLMMSPVEEAEAVVAVSQIAGVVGIPRVPLAAAGVVTEVKIVGGKMFLLRLRLKTMIIKTLLVSVPNSI